MSPAFVFGVVAAAAFEKFCFAVQAAALGWFWGLFAALGWVWVLSACAQVQGVGVSAGEVLGGFLCTLLQCTLIS